MDGMLILLTELVRRVIVWDEADIGAFWEMEIMHCRGKNLKRTGLRF
jgi:hypothetical protein